MDSHGAATIDFGVQVTPLSEAGWRGLVLYDACGRNTPATPDHSAAFGEKILSQFVSIEFILNQALKLTRSVCLRAF
jgi:hypothetical protein